MSSVSGWGNNMNIIVIFEIEKLELIIVVHPIGSEFCGSDSLRADIVQIVNRGLCDSAWVLQTEGSSHITFQTIGEVTPRMICAGHVYEYNFFGGEGAPLVEKMVVHSIEVSMLVHHRTKVAVQSIEELCKTSELRIVSTRL